LCRQCSFAAKAAIGWLGIAGQRRFVLSARIIFLEIYVGKKISKAPRMDDTGCSRTKEVSKAENTDRKNRTRAEENRGRDATEGV
jgi:hypothetical protein